MAAFMGVIGAVDCTHILLVSLVVTVPSNRKEYSSLNVQAVGTVSE